MKLDEDLKRWERDEPRYQELKKHLCNSLKPLFLRNGLNVAIQARVKTGLSLYKKMIEKRNKKRYSYYRMRDKLGVRIICKFQDEIPIICKIIDENFDVKKTENKVDNYAPEIQGYKGIHKDTKLKSTDKNYKKFRGLFFEIQIRTMCDNVWADIYHDVGYKPENMPSDNAKRELYCLGGVLEIADKCFSRVYQDIASTDILSSEFMLYFLTDPFYRIFSSSYRINYSLENLKFFTPLLNNNGINTVGDFRREIGTFIDEKKDLLERISQDYRDDFMRNPLISQPEVFIIFYLLEKDRYGLQKEWKSHFVMKYLEDLSTWWGKPMLN